MSLYLVDSPNGDTFAVIKDLQMICPHPDLAIEYGYDTDTGGRKSGRISFRGKDTPTIGSRIIKALADAPCLVVVRGADQGFLVSGGVRTLRDVGGVTLYDQLPAPTSVIIVYDATDCNGDGQWVRDSRGEKRRFPTYLALFHELSHAYHLCNGTFNAQDPEAAALADENELRRTLGLFQRQGHDGGCGPLTPPPPDTNGTEKTPRIGCYIATAAHGSPLAPDVEILRRFRDDVLRKTRAGRAFFERFWDHYYRVSPAIVEMMSRDPDVKDVVRWSIVTPVVRYLELLHRFPDAPLDGVPEPWRSFLASTRDNLERFAEEIELPYDFTGLTALEAAEEIGLVLRYVLRSEPSRADYLVRLATMGQIPLAAGAEERAAIEDRLRALSRSEGEIRQILGAPEGTARGRSLGVALARGASAEVGPRTEIPAGELPYTVTIRNATTVRFDRVVLFYKRKNQPGVVFLQELDVAPGEARVFVLEIARLVESYVVGCFRDDQMVARLPGQGQEMTAALASTLNPTDTYPAADSWAVEGQWSVPLSTTPYLVTVQNGTPDTFTEITVFYKRRGQSGVVVLFQQNVAPQQTSVFNLGPADQMESYAFAAYLSDAAGEYEAARFPIDGVMTPLRASLFKPSDTDPTTDRWTIS